MNDICPGCQQFYENCYCDEEYDLDGQSDLYFDEIDELDERHTFNRSLKEKKNKKKDENHKITTKSIINRDVEMGLRCGKCEQPNDKCTCHPKESKCSHCGSNLLFNKDTKTFVECKCWYEDYYDVYDMY